MYETYRRIYVSDSNILRMEIIQKHHNSPVAEHLGYEKTIELLQHNYWWPGMATLVKDYVTRCNTCQRFKGSNQAPEGLLQPLPIPNTPWEHISANCIKDLPLSHGYDSILMIVDRLSKEVDLIACMKTCLAWTQQSCSWQTYGSIIVSHIPSHETEACSLWHRLCRSLTRPSVPLLSY